MIVHLQVRQQTAQKTAWEVVFKVRESMLRETMDEWKRATTRKDDAEVLGLDQTDPAEWTRLHSDMIAARKRFYDLVETFTGRRPRSPDGQRV